MPTTAATLTGTAGQNWRNGLHPQRPPIWLGAIVAIAGLTIASLAIRTDWTWFGDISGFGFKPSSMMLACGGLALFVSGVTVVLSASRRKIGEWLLIGVAALAVAMAADIPINFQQSKQTSVNVAAQEVRANKRARRAAFLKASVQTAAQQNPTAKFVMLALLAGAVGLTRWSASSREQLESNRQARTLTADTASMSRLLWLEVQLGLLVLVIRQFNLVSPVFDHQISLLIFFGFLVHYLLPLQYRLPFFLLLSFSAIFFIFGFVQAGWLIGIGLVLIGLCHLPVSFLLRVVLLVLAGIGLVELRAGWGRPPWGNAVWPILASMFMFRLIVYLYSLQHRKAPVSAWFSLSYFFLLPNVVFPLFPVVDYATFQRTYYDADRHLIHQRGLKWILWGVIHLVLYRWVYYYMVIGPDDVNSVTNLARYLVSNFLLILRLSGQFHLIIGVLLLFGFNLPRIMNLYWWADSFTDFWRRANIYWRDFMQRVVFYPIYFRLRKWPPAASLLCATVAVFLVTWALHTYQWFWLLGSFSISAPDVLFWTLFGTLVAANSLYEAKTASKRAAVSCELSFRQIAWHTLRIVGTFCAICLLWSIWVSTSVSEWVSLWSVPGLTWKDITTLTPALLGGVGVAACGAVLLRRQQLRAGATALPARAAQVSFFASATPTAALILALLIVSQPPIYSRFNPKLAGLIQELRTEKLSRQDVALLDRAYYENLTRVDRFNSQLWEVYNKGAIKQQEEAGGGFQRPEEWRRNYSSAGDFLGLQLRPFVESVLKRTTFRTNRWGMRDKDYELIPPPRTCRVALLGGSPEMNSGVSNDELFEAVVEERLNRENDHKAVNQYEILNFAAATHTALHRLAMFETKALSFQPDIVFYIAHPSDRTKAVYRLAECVMTGTPIPYDYLRQIVNKAGLKRDMPLRLMRVGLEPYGNEIIAGAYQRIVAGCRARAIVPVFIYLPTIKALGTEEMPDHLRLAAEAGFNVVNLSDIFDNLDETTLRRNEMDSHPNAKGHQVIADRVYEALRKNPALLQKVK